MKNAKEHQPIYGPRAHIEAAASELLDEGKKRAHDIYEEGVNKVNEAEDNIKEYSDQLMRKIQKNPLASVLIAGGIGYLLSKIMK